jgi:putative ABC transport system ATP-binding protein
MNPIIDFKNLSVVYNPGKTNEVWALRKITGEIYPQEYIIFFGPSGCGKSTLLYAIAGLENLTEGSVNVFGKNLKNFTPKERQSYHCSSVGMIFQSYYLVPALTVRDNILLPQMFAGENSINRFKKAQQLMERFNIAHLANRKPAKLSGGQQQRVAIARALINDPPIILADEPVGNLDSASAQNVIDLLSEINEKDKKTIILVTHDPRRLHLANRVIYMEDGLLTRTVVNPNKTNKFLAGSQTISDLDKLAQIYPYLSESQLRAKLILNHFLLPYGIEIQQKIEAVINKYLLKKINEIELLKALDESPINLYSQKAKDLVRKIIPLVQEMEKMESEKHLTATPVEEKAAIIRRYLLDNFSGHISLEQIQKMEEIIIQRLTGRVDKENLEKLLDLPLRQGGSGLDKRTARRFVRQIEVILMKS